MATSIRKFLSVSAFQQYATINWNFLSKQNIIIKTKTNIKHLLLPVNVQVWNCFVPAMSFKEVWFSAVQLPAV